MADAALSFIIEFCVSDSLAEERWKRKNFSIHNDDDHRGRFEHFLDYFKNEKQNFIKFIYSNLINGQDVYSC